MDFIRQHCHVISAAEFTDTLQILPAPYIPRGVMRIAEYHHCCEWICQLLFQIIKINDIFSSFILQPVFQYMTAMVFNGMKKNIINRCLHHHVIPNIRHPFYGTGHRRDNSGTKNKPFLLHPEAMPPVPPAYNRLIPFLRHYGIAKYTVL